LNTKHKPATLAVHAGKQAPPDSRPISTPIYQTANFFLDEDVQAAIQDGKRGEHYTYTRYGNPTQAAAAGKIAALEGAEAGLVFASGMAAITSVLLAYLKPGDHLAAARDLYGGTSGFLQRLESMGVAVTLFDTEDLESARRALRPDTRMVYFETLTNPLVRVADTEALARLAHEAGALAVVDNTFPTPINHRPLEWGVDLVIHSGSKYLNGHSDVICGAVAGPADKVQPVWKALLQFGGCMDPTAAWHLERGLKTLALRMERHNTNGLELASWLETHPAVDQVFYPFLASNPRLDLARRYLAGGSGMIGLRVKGGDTAAMDMLNRLELFSVATSLGGVESLVSMPLLTSHALFSAEERARLGILPGTLRLSVGIEDAGDLRRDLEAALNSINR